MSTTVIHLGWQLLASSSLNKDRSINTSVAPSKVFHRTVLPICAVSSYLTISPSPCTFTQFFMASIRFLPSITNHDHIKNSVKVPGCFVSVALSRYSPCDELGGYYPLLIAHAKHEPRNDADLRRIRYVRFCDFQRSFCVFCG